MADPTPRFRRSLAAHASPGRCEAGLEDDFHHFRVALEHDGERVIALRSEHLRIPRTVCAEAADPLQGFVGQRLDAISVPLDPRDNCTHAFDLTRLAMAQAHRGGSRRYDIEVPYVVDGSSRARLSRDGVAVFDWELRDRVVISPGPFHGIDFRGRVAWPAGLDDDMLEAAKILRRGIWLGWERANGSRAAEAGELKVHRARVSERLSGACYGWKPVNVVRGESFRGMHIRNFSAAPESVLAEFPLP